MKNSDLSYFTSPPKAQGKQFFVQEWNPAHETVVLFIHGFPGCGDQAKLITTTSMSTSFRLIAVDRPGYGESDFQPMLTPLKFAEQLVEILDHLKIDKLRLLSVSGGAPYSLALAHLLGERVERMCSVAGVAPLTRKNFQYMNSQQRKTWLLSQCLPKSVQHAMLNRVWLKGVERVEEFLFSPTDGVHGPDQVVFAHPDISPVLSATLKRALSQGPRGIIHDLNVYARDWGFKTDGIACPVTLWHGTKDDVVHLAYAKDMKTKLKNANLRIIDDEGHFSIAMNFRDHIISDLLLKTSS
ncbi:MAG: alpha/beta hydrolase [Bdellovibrionaceae bacterium]|nr:alpha/beta hydrolase [Pseudobdellovibrionaceae bacterium]